MKTNPLAGERAEASMPVDVPGLITAYFSERSDPSVPAQRVALRPSGTEDIYEIYAESFRGADHLRRILAEAQEVVSNTLAVEPETPADR